MQVGAADSGIVHADKDFARADFGDGQGNDFADMRLSDLKSTHRDSSNDSLGNRDVSERFNFEKDEARGAAQAVLKLL